MSTVNNKLNELQKIIIQQGSETKTAMNKLYDRQQFLHNRTEILEQKTEMSPHDRNEILLDNMAWQDNEISRNSVSLPIHLNASQNPNFYSHRFMNLLLSTLKIRYSDTTTLCVNTNSAFCYDVEFH